MKLKNILISVGVLLFVFVVILMWVNNHGGLKPSGNMPVSQNSNSASPSQLTIKTIDVNLMPPGIPSDLPIEKGAAVTENSDITNPQTGTRQSTRTYITTKKIADNFSAYKKYVAGKKWQLLSTIDNPDYKNITASTGSGTITFIINYHTGTANNTVSIYYTYTPSSNATK